MLIFSSLRLRLLSTFYISIMLHSIRIFSKHISLCQVLYCSCLENDFCFDEFFFLAQFYLLYPTRYYNSLLFYSILINKFIYFFLNLILYETFSLVFFLSDFISWNSLRIIKFYQVGLANFIPYKYKTLN